VTNYSKTWDDLTEDERRFYPPQITRAVAELRDLVAELERASGEGQIVRTLKGISRALDGWGAAIADWHHAVATGNVVETDRPG
jgi:hypothetical protein